MVAGVEVVGATEVVEVAVGALCDSAVPDGEAEVVVVEAGADGAAESAGAVALAGVSEVPCDAEPEDDAEGAGAAEAEVADGATLDTASTRSVPGATVDVVAITGGTEEATTVVATASTAAAAVVGPEPLSPPEEQAEPTNPKAATTATAKTHFVFLITENLSSENSGFIF